MSAVQLVDFFQSGGTLKPGSPSYVERPADAELFELVQKGQFCYVLTPRQMGKSSLKLSTADRLRDLGIRTASIDLDGLGTKDVTVEQWYLGLITVLQQELGLAVTPEQWWRARPDLSTVQRFTDFLHDVILTEIDTQVVIFIDEIDSTLGLSFTDDFFAAIRFVYNRRATQPEYKRLTFVLLGVAAPTDLIRDPQRTPFNIGRPIELKELDRADALPLQQGLEQAYPGQGNRLLDRVFYWTNGHPYLTQRLCLAIIEVGGSNWTDERVDELVAELFLGEAARKEVNLESIRNSVESSPECGRLVQLYRRIYEGQTVREDEQSYLQNRLKLTGLIGTTDRILQVRNEIYRRVFNQTWIAENTPVPWTKWITVGAVFVSILAIVLTVFFLRWQAQQELATKMETYINRFQRSEDADIRLNALAGLCELDKQQEAQTLFFNLEPGQQLDLLHKVKVEGAGEKLVTVIDCLYPGIVVLVTDVGHRQALSEATCCTLYKWNTETGQQFSRKIGYSCKCEIDGESDNE